MPRRRKNEADGLEGLSAPRGRSRPAGGEKEHAGRRKGVEKVASLKGLNLHGFPATALAAYGLLRRLEGMGLDVALSFTPDGLFTARLHGMGEEELLDHLERYGLFHPGWYGLIPPQEELKEGEDWKARLHRKAREVLEEEKGAHIPEAEKRGPYLRALVNPWTPEGKAQVTPLNTFRSTGAFLRALQKVAGYFGGMPRQRVREHFRCALFHGAIQPPDRLDGCMRGRKPAIPELRWHVVYGSVDLTVDGKRPAPAQSPRLRPAVLFLALEGLTFYPFTPRGRLPLGWTVWEGRPTLLTPAPERPVRSDELKGLIALAPMGSDEIKGVPVLASPRLEEPWPHMGMPFPYRPQPAP